MTENRIKKVKCLICYYDEHINSLEEQIKGMTNPLYIAIAEKTVEDLKYTKALIVGELHQLDPATRLKDSIKKTNSFLTLCNVIKTKEERGMA